MAREKTSLLSFPVEIAQNILSLAPDALSLRALILSCSFFHRAFIVSPSLILHSVVRNEIHALVLPDALATLATANLSPRKRDRVRDFLAQANLFPASIPEYWSMSDSLKLSKINSHVKYFATDFGSTLCADLVTGVPNEAPLALTLTERHRIERAFYRFEIYCNLFGKHEKNPRSTFKPEEQKQMFLDKFPPWENEQLASIREYLCCRLYTPFNEVAEHDVVWGEKSIPFLGDDSSLPSHHQEHYLSLGLAYLHRLFTASTYDERYQLLDPQLQCLSGFLTAALSEDDLFIEDLTEEERSNRLKPPVVGDPDIGPAEAWYWAYRGGPDEYMYFERGQRQLRKHGYVMLDYDTLCESKIFAEPFQPSTPTFDTDGRKLRFEQMEKSWDDRSKVWMSGGRGWWSEDDQSKLLWPFRK